MGQGAINYVGTKGGLKLNDVIEEFKYVYQGQNITAGDFVNYINGVANSTTTSTTYDSQTTTIRDDSNYCYGTCAVKLTDTRVLVAWYNNDNYYLYACVCVINKMTITVGSSYKLYSISDPPINGVALDNSNVLLLPANGKSTSTTYPRCVWLSISGSTITKKDYIDLDGDGNSDALDIIKLDSSRALCLFNNTDDTALCGQIVTINSSGSMSSSSLYSISSSSESIHSISAFIHISASPIKIFVSYTNGDSHIRCTYLKLNGSSLSVERSPTTIASSYNDSVTVTSLLMDTNKVLILYGDGDNEGLYGTTTDLSSTNFPITTKTSLAQSGYHCGLESRGVTINSTRAFIFFGYTSKSATYNTTWNFRGIYVNINGSTLSPSANVIIDSIYSTRPDKSCVLLDKTSFCTWWHQQMNTTAIGSVEGRMINISMDNPMTSLTETTTSTTYEQQVTIATEPPFDAIALSNGTGGTSTAHNQQVKIAKPNGGAN